MEEKRCFKCGRVLPLSEFYPHIRMKDGYMGKCKDCTKADAKGNYERKSAYPGWVEKERVRGREKFKRLNYKGKFSNTRDLCPEGANIARRLRVLGYDTSDKEAHHWNYNKPYSIFLLSRKAHKRIHQHLRVNKSDKKCYTDSGEGLDTEEQAKAYFNSILVLYGMIEDLNPIHLY